MKKKNEDPQQNNLPLFKEPKADKIKCKIVRMDDYRRGDIETTKSDNTLIERLISYSKISIGNFKAINLG